jgi:hypothetical protein
MYEVGRFGRYTMYKVYRRVSTAMLVMGGWRWGWYRTRFLLRLSCLVCGLEGTVYSIMGELNERMNEHLNEQTYSSPLPSSNLTFHTVCPTSITTTTQQHHNIPSTYSSIIHHPSSYLISPHTQHPSSIPSPE